VGANIEVGKRRSRLSAGASIREETLPREERRSPGKRESSEPIGRQRLVEILDAFEADGDLCVDERVDR
jgi:hypothetical protein